MHVLPQRLTGATLLALLLAACGGGSDNSSDTAAPTTPPVTTPPPVVAVPDPVQPGKDLASFAAAWVSYTMVQAVPMLQLAAGASDNCPLGGTARYDAAAGRQVLAACRTRQAPDQAFTGSYAVGQLTSSAGTTTAALSAPAVEVFAAADGAREFALTGGSIASEVVDNDAGDRYFFTSPSLDFTAGAGHRYAVSNAGSTSIAVTFEQQVPVRETANLVFTTSDGSDTWQVTVTGGIRERGDRPDRGSLTIVRLGAQQALNATFGSDGTVTLVGGEQGGTRTLGWTDATLQAALAAARQ